MSRVKNRLREHSKEGCQLSVSKSPFAKKPDTVLYDCTCGWRGWLPKDIL